MLKLYNVVIDMMSTIKSNRNLISFECHHIPPPLSLPCSQIFGVSAMLQYYYCQNKVPLDTEINVFKDFCFILSEMTDFDSID